MANAKGKLGLHAASETVTNGTVGAIVVSPSTASLAHSATQQYTAAADDGYGHSIPMDDENISWSTTVTGGSVDEDTGLVTAGSTDGTTFKVRATHDVTGVYGEATVVVVS